MVSDCPGANGLVCIRGWLYSQMNMMIFPANKRCPKCNLRREDDDGADGTDDVTAVAERTESEARGG